MQTVKQNHIGSAVSEINCCRHTNNLLLFYYYTDEKSLHDKLLLFQYNMNLILCKKSTTFKNTFLLGNRYLKFFIIHFHCLYIWNLRKINNKPKFYLFCVSNILTKFLDFLNCHVKFFSYFVPTKKILKNSEW